MRILKIITIYPAALLLTFTGCQGPSNIQNLDYSSTEALVQSAKGFITEITPSMLREMMDSEEMYVLLDVRNKGEFERGYIPGAVNIPRGSLEFWIGKESFWDDEGMYVPLQEDKLILTCRSGNRSSLSAYTLQKMGYNDVYSLEGGWLAWKEAYPDLVLSMLPATTDGPAAPVAEEEEPGGC